MPRFVKPQFGEKERAAAEKCGSPEYQISFTEFSAKAENKTKIMFGRGVYLDEHTLQAASVRLVRLRRTRRAHSRLQKARRKAPKGIFAERGGSPGWIQNSRYFAIMVLNSSWAEGGV